MNTPGGNSVSAAEHTIALLLALARRVPAADAVMKAGGWDRNKFVGTQVAGKTLGVIGLGRIGREVARRAKGLDMEVIALDPFVTAAKAAELGYEIAASLDELLPKVDFLTIHVPLSDETKSLIGARELGADEEVGARPERGPRRDRRREGAGRRPRGRHDRRGRGGCLLRRTDRRRQPAREGPERRADAAPRRVAPSRRRRTSRSRRRNSSPTSC